MTIEEYFADWSNVVDLKEADKILKRVSKQNVCPQPKDIFKAFKLCPLRDLRAIIIAQDPYPDFYNNKPRATGIAFANTSETPEKDLSPSLEILKESIIDFTIPHEEANFDPSLEKWEEQGVLLLNSALTCRQGQPGSHSLLWRPFTRNLLLNLSKHTTGIVYVLMGSSAQSFESFIDSRFNHIIKCKHPSYYARTSTSMPSSIWQEINNILIGQNGYGIKWYNN
jgi:uracil-DNA glycosylase